MANKTKRSGGRVDKQAVLVGSAVAVAALGAYFVGTERGRKQAKKMKGWMVEMSGRVMDKLESAQEVTEPVYHEIVDTVASAQAAAGKVPKNEIMALAMHLKRQWNIIQRIAGKKSASRSARNTGRRTSGNTSSSKKRSAKKSGKSRSAKR